MNKRVTVILLCLATILLLSGCSNEKFIGVGETSETVFDTFNYYTPTDPSSAI